MRKTVVGLVLGLLIIPLIAAAQSPDEPKSRIASKTQTIAGVSWETSLESAKRRAAEERKPILLLHLFGRLDEELC